MRSLVVLVLAAALLSCKERKQASNLNSDSREASGLPERRRIGYDKNGRPASVALSEVVVTGVSELPVPTPVDTASNMLIRTATAWIRVDSLEIAVAQVKQLAAQFGGYVASSGIEAGQKRLRNATLEVKIPATRFDDALSGLTPIGEVETVNVSTEDVGEEYVDVNARMDNARRLERRLIDLLATRTGKLKDVLDVERELARVREEIDRYQGRIRYLTVHTAMSTLSVTVHEPVPVVGTAGKSVMGEAFTQAWRNFVMLLSLAVQSLGVVLPLGLVALAAWFVTRRWRLRGA